ncbi:MAG: sulfurtransferase [Actinobacteria bacterium]|nr:sulfurtransferase [Actinomycetota bacterium]
MTVRVERDGAVTIVTMDRPDRRNAVDGQAAKELAAAFRAFDADEKASVAILTGAGGHFCAGADLKALSERHSDPDRDPGYTLAPDQAPLGPTRMLTSKPLIAAVEGYAVAGGIFAARLAWMLRAIGRDAALLDGGLAAWGAPLDTGAGPGRPAAAFTPVPWPSAWLASIDEVAAAAVAPAERASAEGGPGGSCVLLDARAPERFRGEAEPVDPRAGHIPGAVNAPCMAHMGADGALLPPDALRDQFAAVGITTADGAVAYCGSGVNACHSPLVMEHAGLGRGRLFPGSWSAWSNQPGSPVATGPARA